MIENKIRERENFIQKRALKNEYEMLVKTKSTQTSGKKRFGKSESKMFRLKKKSYKNMCQNFWT